MWKNSEVGCNSIMFSAQGAIEIWGDLATEENSEFFDDVDGWARPVITVITLTNTV